MYKGVSLVGDLVRKNSILSNFSNTNYATLPNVFNPAGNDFETVFKFTTSDISSTAHQFIFSAMGANNRGFRILINGNSKVINITFHNADNSDWGGGFTSAGVQQITSDTTYKIKVQRSGNSVRSWIALENGDWQPLPISAGSSNYVITIDYNLITFTDSCLGVNIIPSSATANQPLYGTIDLTGCYINISNSLWWKGADNFKAFKETTRHYYKYITTEDDWEQPTITANGTLGGDEFAVAASSSAGNYPAYKAFVSGGWNASSATAATFTFYNPNPIKVSGLAFSGVRNTGVYINSYNLFGSNDNSTWTQIGGTYTQNTNATDVVYNDITNDNYYKYYRINSVTRKGVDGIANLVISALEQVTDIEESTSSDYDFYKDIDTYKGFINTTLKTSQTFYPSNEIKSWTVPSGISSIHVKCAGAKGTDSKDNATLGGNGGIVECDLAVSSGQTLYFVVGQSNTIGYTASYNASDIRTNNAGITDSTSLASRIIVAGAGGNSGWTGTKSARGVGGLGGGTTAGNGESKGYNTGGAGATQSTGYSIGMGGNGTGSRGGAGGAGYYGGFGGTWHGHNGVVYCGGGGGGSSYTNADCSNVVHSQGANEGDAYITISSSQPIFPVNTYSLLVE